jgi:hypothetical protein
LESSKAKEELNGTFWPGPPNPGKLEIEYVDVEKAKQNIHRWDKTQEKRNTSGNSGNDL